MPGRSADRTVACMTTSTSTLGRLGAWSSDHRRRVVIIWAAVVLCLGALAPFADGALSGAGWEAPNSESGDARRAIDARFPGQGTYALSVVVANKGDRSLHPTLDRVTRVLRGDRAVRGVLPPRRGAAVSRDGRTTIVTRLAGHAPPGMVGAARRVEGPLCAVFGPGGPRRPPGPPPRGGGL